MAGTFKFFAEVVSTHQNQIPGPSLSLSRQGWQQHYHDTDYLAEAYAANIFG